MREGTIYERELEDGRSVFVYQMVYTARLCIGPTDWDVYDRGWCYQNSALAIAAATIWEGDGDPPPPWIKEVGTERRRVNGDPALEYDAKTELPPKAAA